MPIYHRLGEVPKKRHTQFRKPDGSLYKEHLFGVRGFSGPQSLLYRHNAPTAVKKIELLGAEAKPRLLGKDAAFRHRHFVMGKAQPKGDPISGRRYVLANDDITIGISLPEKAMDYFFCNANRDEVIFVHQGSGSFDSMFGRLPYMPGDYIVVPKGTIYQINPDFAGTTRFLHIETPNNIELPARYRNEVGQLLEHSPYCARDFRLPNELITHDEQGDFIVQIKTTDKTMEYHLANHPFDVVGWDGYLYPYIFNIGDFEPITGRLHMPPPVHQTFAAQGFVICSFVPRLFDYHPQAIAVPYNHSNVESDEVLYYVSGDFMSRKGISQASITMHPGGLPHGPQPGAVEASLGATKTDELAVMVDTFRPLHVVAEAEEFDDPEYPYSWVK
jgi:homogentisate 1,2-dioxygenase